MTGIVVHHDPRRTPRQPVASRATSRVRFEFGRRTEARGTSALTPGSVIELDRAHDGPVDVYSDGRLIARGEAVVVNGKLAVRISELTDSKPGRRNAES